MSIDGHMLCENCKEWIFLGKWLRDDDKEGIGFWLSGLNDDELGMKITRFIAKHIDHRIRVMLEHVFYQEYDVGEYRRADADFGDDSFEEAEEFWRRRKKRQSPGALDPPDESANEQDNGESSEDK